MELTGGLCFVEGHNKPNEYGSLSKRYYFGGEEGVRKLRRASADEDVLVAEARCAVQGRVDRQQRIAKFG